MDVPCDAILIEGSVSVDESAMTGESDELKKETLETALKKKEEYEEENEKPAPDAKEGVKTDHHAVPTPVLLSGTSIQTGGGSKILITVVGKRSAMGKIKEALSQTGAEMTPLQMKLEAIATDIGKLGMVSAYVTVMVLFIRFWIEQGIAGYDWGNNYFSYISDWFRHIITGVTIIVVAVPEGLPLAVMISLAYSVRKMLRDMNFVKRLASCEIMGGANNICSDKTGTLTMNKMHVTNIWHGTSTELPAAPHKQMGVTQEKGKKKKKAKFGEEPAEAPRD